MKEVTTSERKRMLTHLLGKHEEQLESHRKVFAAFRTGEEALRSVAAVAKYEAEVAYLAAALVALG